MNLPLIPDLRTIAVSAAVGLVVGALSSWWLTAEYKDNKWQAVVQSDARKAADALQAATAKTLAAERQAHQLANQLETSNAESSAAQDRLLTDNRRLARELGGLRDPGKRSGCPVPAASAAGQPESGSAGAQLSAEATEFLLEFARDADRAAQYAVTCHTWIEKQAPTEEHQ